MIEETQVVRGWRVHKVWSEDSPFPVELHITGGDGKGIPSTVLREITLTRPDTTEGAAITRIQELTAVMAELKAFPSAGRDTVTDDYLRALARAYNVVAGPYDKNPVKTLAEATGRNRKTLANHLTKARTLGYLNDK